MRYIADGNDCAGRLVKHPTGDVDAKLRIFAVGRFIERLNSHDHRRLITLPDSSQHSDAAIEERMKAIENPCRPELPGSV